MRIASSLALVTATLALGGVARAQQPSYDPYTGPPEAVQPSQPINPYDNAPPVYSYPPPAYPYAPPPPPMYQPPPPPIYTQPYYVYPTPPVYIQPAPPVIYRARLYCPSGLCTARRPVRTPDFARRFSLGVHGTVLGLNQQVGKDNVVLGGAGLQFRFRSRGRFGLELMQSFLHADYWNGNWQRSSYPFQMSLMLYLMPNDDSHHFNLYGLAGFGIMFDSMQLRDENRNLVSQDFVEWEGHLGLGAELRFKWFAIEADVRALGLVRDNDSAPASFYRSVAGAPIPEKSYGFSGNAYVSLWF